jgi:hypothetical protein
MMLRLLPLLRIADLFTIVSPILYDKHRFRSVIAHSFGIRLMLASRSSIWYSIFWSFGCLALMGEKIENAETVCETLQSIM